MKKFLMTACACLLAATTLISCGKKEDEKQVLKVAGLKGAYGDAYSTYWKDRRKRTVWHRLSMAGRHSADGRRFHTGTSYTGKR